MPQRRASDRLDPSIPFRRPVALALGLTDRELCGPRFQRVFTGVYVGAEVVVDIGVRAKAALTVCPVGSHVSHFTAAELLDLAPPWQPLTHVSVPAHDEGTRRRGIRSHELADESDVILRDGVRLSGPVRAFLELAEFVSLVDLVIIGDRIVRKEMATRERLLRAAQGWNGRGARLARRAAKLVRADVDSPMETRLRLLIVLSGLPEPKVNLVLRNADGSWRLRLDLSYPQLRLVIEYDGRQHAEDDVQWDRDIDRREDLDNLGWRLIVVRSAGIFVDPESTLLRVARALRSRGCDDVPRRFNAEWWRHFPARSKVA